ncbi:MscS Mechanosensitive ion channel family protein [Oleispira antarctica RB-8]|uniref:Small-conductance mechanosensitive channel n=1 Tax=Oleispira antarctica RB-8 TaxID=698738 RepID=R4YKP3_OLEAN|nr:MscS Mechanosensitive ion channel family protein [Oleispira antarctica RB-8]|tara:strand:+ start:1059 stop:1892 length:834 start_codon:yes stop_codon:yes gene_type:complete
MENFDLKNIDLHKIFEQGQGLMFEYSLKIIAALAIYIIGRLLAKLIAKGILKALKIRNIDDTVASFIHNLSYGALYVFVIIAALSQLGIQTASFITVIGAAGLAIGLALQGSLSNFASGVLMIIFRPFKIGDYVEAGGKSGTVEDIQIFCTRLKTPDNKVVIIPNSSIMDDSIVNYSTKEMRRVDLKIGVSYDAYLPDVTALLKKTVEANAKVLHAEGYKIAVLELGDSSVNFVVRTWAKTPEYWDVYFELTESIKLALDENNIGIPYPQMDVHMQK